MSELEKEVHTSETSEDTSTSEQSETSEDNTTSDKKKFDVWKEYKKLKKENRVLKATFEEDEDTPEEEEAQKTNTFDETKLDIFLLKNKEALEYEEEIKEVLWEYPNMPYAQAYSFAKANFTKSQTIKSFSTKSATPKKELKDYTKEEVMAMKDSKKLLEWSRVTWQLR